MFFPIEKRTFEIKSIPSPLNYQIQMQIIIEKQELKNALGLYLQENPQLMQVWLRGCTNNNLPAFHAFCR